MFKITSEIFFNACKKNDIITVEQFINEKKFPIDIKTKEGWTGLILACFNESYNVAKLLIENNADINATNSKGTTVFMYAKTPIQSKQDQTSFLKFLLEKGAQINAMDIYNKTVLDYVIEKKCFILAKWLQKNGAKATIENEN
jgi:methionyl-tRNA formyltransferase